MSPRTRPVRRQPSEIAGLITLLILAQAAFILCAVALAALN